jgi:hypothetical protein
MAADRSVIANPAHASADTARSKIMPIPSTLKRYADKIQCVDDDRNNQNGWWVHLKNGWINPQSETHMIHEDTLKQCLAQLREVEPCQCEDCIH